MKKYTLENILNHVKDKYIVVGNKKIKVDNIKSPFDADSCSMVFIDKNHEDPLSLIKKTRASLIIGHFSLTLPYQLTAIKCLLQVDQPKLVFSRLANAMFVSKPKFTGVHESSFIHPEAKIAENVYIGPFTYIGKSIIGAGTVIYGNCHIYDNVTIGKNCKIQAGCILGATGFGYVKNEKEEYENFPHIGKVIIGNEVEIGANCCVDQGALSNTVIDDGTKIDNFVHVGHNTVIGKNTMITAGVVFSGSTTVGNNCYFAPNSTTAGHLTIGHHVFIGTGSVVTKNVPSDSTWVGSPARPIDVFRQIQNSFKKISS